MTTQLQIAPLTEGELGAAIRDRFAEIHGGINPLHADRDQFNRFLRFVTQLAEGRLVVLHTPDNAPLTPL